MSFRIKVTRNFEREAKPLKKKYPSFKNDIALFLDELLHDPESGTSLGHNLYKVRMVIASKGRGKSGGARVITYALIKQEIIHLISIYDKGEYDTVETDVLLKIMQNEGL